MRGSATRPRVAFVAEGVAEADMGRSPTSGDQCPATKVAGNKMQSRLEAGWRIADHVDVLHTREAALCSDAMNAGPRNRPFEVSTPK